MGDHGRDDSDRPEKRQRLDEEQQQAEEQQEQQAGGVVDDTAPPAPPPAHDQISAALTKIRNHLGNKNKFSKASQLLRQLLDAVDKSHRNELFATVKAAFTNPEHCIDPLLRKDYARLMKALFLRVEGILSRQQRAQLEVYSIWALLRNELFTDDSFVFNKVVGKIKAAVAELSDADEEQQAAWNVLHGGAAAKPADKPQQQQQQQQQQQPLQDDAEADPFGLNDFIAKAEAQAAEAEAEAAAAAAAAEAPTEEQPSQQQQEGAPWDAATMQVMRKQALLDCLVAAKEHQHKLAWARTSVELLIEAVAKPAAQGGFADKFVAGQRQQLTELLRFVNAERAARKSGVNRRPGGKGTGEYQTSFEKARADWSGANWVSARGKVGSAGDAKSQNWLG